MIGDYERRKPGLAIRTRRLSTPLRRNAQIGPPDETIAPELGCEQRPESSTEVSGLQAAWAGGAHRRRLRVFRPRGAEPLQVQRPPGGSSEACRCGLGGSMWTRA